MYRIHTSTPREKWRFVCPTDDQHTDWRVVDGLFECRACGETFKELVDQKTGERIKREEIEMIGPHADHKGAFGRPTVE
jgi:ribosomal protein L37AE/L43A